MSDDTQHALDLVISSCLIAACHATYSDEYLQLHSVIRQSKKIPSVLGRCTKSRSTKKMGSATHEPELIYVVVGGVGRATSTPNRAFVDVDWWCGEGSMATTCNTTTSPVLRARPDSKENGGWKTTSYHPHQSGGREGGTWDKGFGHMQGHTIPIRPMRRGGVPSRDKEPNYMPSTGQSCGSGNGTNTTTNTPY